MNRPPCPLARILKVYIEALTGFSHVFSPGGLRTASLSQGSILRAASSVDKEGGRLIPGAGTGVRSHQSSRASLWVRLLTSFCGTGRALDWMIQECGR